MVKNWKMLILLLPLMTHIMGGCSGNKKSEVKRSKENSSKTEEIQILEKVVIDSVPADFPVSFRIATADNMQFIAYYNKNRNLTVASRKVSEKDWSYKILPTKVGWDSHNSIVMAFDRDNCIHVSGNMHNDTLTYFKSDKPYDVASLQRIYPMTNAPDESRCTYPKFIKNREGQLIYSYRKGGSGNGITISNSYDEKTKRFKRLTDKPLFDGLGEMSAYASGPGKGPDNKFHVIWYWRDTPACETNHDLSYARSSDLVHWENAYGKQMELPITPRSSQFTVDAVPPKGGVLNGVKRLFFNVEKQPLIVYMKYDDMGNSQLFIARFNQNKWEFAQITQWDYRWDFKGPGSMGSEIKINEAHCTNDGEIQVKYWHIKKGNGEIRINADNLRPVEDKAIEITKKSAYPKELSTATRKDEGMSVKWMRINGLDSNEYYGVRWETQGKRRFYEAPETPIRPSPLVIYKFRKTIMK